MKHAVTTATLSVAMLVAVGCTGDSLDSRSTDPPDRPVPSTLPTGSLPAPPSSPPTGWPIVPGRDDPRPPGGPFGTSRLTFFGDCVALVEHMRAEAGARVTPWGLAGGGWYGPMWRGDLAADDVDDAADSGAFTSAPAAAEPDFSGTNTQEVGVDEGDIVETDGRYVYTTAAAAVRIVEVEGARVAATAPLPDGSHEMILDDDRLLVATRTWSSGDATVVSVFDVTDPARPSLLRRSHLEGRLVASRSVDGVVRLVLSSSLDVRLPFVHPDTFGYDEAGALARNREIIEQSAVQDWLPRMFDEAVDGSFAPMTAALDCERVAAPPEFSGLGVSWVASIDLHGEAAPVGSAGIVSQGETVYASPTSLYVATVPWDWARTDPIDESGQRSSGAFREPDEPPTMIHAFSLGTGTGADYLASGGVPGSLLNQFAMSEHEGVLRVATTVHQWDSGRSESSVHALVARGGVLEEISVVGGLGRGERIHAVRFLGPTAYVVTFRQIDPLYVIDMSDPADPVVQGELKIPGYSAYLHPVGDGLLLGVGQDATDEGIALGTQLSLFDVADPTDPRRIDTLPIGGWSDVEWDHRAFLYWPADGTIVLPVSPGWNTCGPQDTCLADGIDGPGGGVVVARLVDRALEAVGVVEHTRDHADPWGGGCWNPLQRSIAIGAELVTVGLDQLRFSDRADLSERATVSWGDGDQYGCTWWWD